MLISLFFWQLFSQLLLDLLGQDEYFSSRLEEGRKGSNHYSCGSALLMAFQQQGANWSGFSCLCSVGFGHHGATVQVSNHGQRAPSAPACPAASWSLQLAWVEAHKNPLNSLSGQLAPAAAGWLWQNAAPCSSERENKEWDKLALGFPHCLWAVSVSGSTHRCFLVMSSAMGSCWRYGMVMCWFFLWNGNIYPWHWKVVLKNLNIYTPPGKAKKPKQTCTILF